MNLFIYNNNNNIMSPSFWMVWTSWSLDWYICC